jgi:acyl-CoA hydrolase
MYDDVETCIDQIISYVGKNIVFGLPLGLAKPAQLINALYQRAKHDPSINLRIITAISLERPFGKSDLESRFIEPFAERVFGGVPDLDYIKEQRLNLLPRNIEVAEFYFKPASFLNHKSAQQNYISTNYTHAPRDLINYGMNVVAQSIGKREQDGEVTYSLSSNSDIFLDVVPLLKEEVKKGSKCLVIGQVNAQMPFMCNDAETTADTFDMIIDNRSLDHRLFSTPNMAISATDHMIGFNASTLVKDGGTLQIGIGSLGDALINASLMRHQRNDDYREMIADLELESKFPIITTEGDRGPFKQGLYGNTEMFVHGYLSLYNAGILKRKVYDNLAIQELLNEGKFTHGITPEVLSELVERRAISARLTDGDVALLKRFGIFRSDVTWRDHQIVVGEVIYSADLSDSDNLRLIARHCLGDALQGGVVLHGAFFLGPEDFYEQLRQLPDDKNREFNMTAVSYTNGLFGQMELKNAQRKDARYINTCMKMSLIGAAASDALENGQVVSGVGGQFNFVAMAHEQPGARSILLLKSTRLGKKGLVSNLVFNYGYTTIPRHLRDIVVTEYGVANLRGKTDSEVIKELIQISDSRFQNKLVAQAQKNGKLSRDYKVPSQYQNNLPQHLAAVIAKYQKRGCFAPFPFSCDFTPEELLLGKTLKSLKQKATHKLMLAKTLIDGFLVAKIPESSRALLDRMDLLNPSNVKQKLMQRLILGELHPRGEALPAGSRKILEFRRSRVRR